MSDAKPPNDNNIDDAAQVMQFVTTLRKYGVDNFGEQMLATATGWPVERVVAALELLETAGLMKRNGPKQPPPPAIFDAKTLDIDVRVDLGLDSFTAFKTFSNVFSAATRKQQATKTTGATAPAGDQVENTEAAKLEQAKLKDLSIDRRGTELVVPDGVSYGMAIKALQLKQQEEDTDVAIDHRFEMTVPEGLFALARALKELCGFVSPTQTPGMFGPTPPAFLGLETGPGEVEMVPWGSFLLPNVTGRLETSIWGEESPKFRLAGVVKVRDKAFIDQLAQHMRASVKTQSIYRGKAIRCDFPKARETSTIEAFFPKFMVLDDVREEHLILNDDAKLLIQTALFTPIERSQKCRDHKIPLKRGILLEGPFGVGKTLSATVTAQKCVQNGWTFIHLNNVKNLAQALEFARQYQPAVIFAEDIDQIVNDDDDDREEAVNDILNQIDGIESKGTEIITVLTTNNLANITTAMLRPGRLDAVVSVRAPDAKAAAQLVRLYAGKLLSTDDDLVPVSQKLAGMIPAVIREVVERSKLGAIRRDSETINAQDIETAADGMKAHSAMLQTQEPDDRSDIELAAAALVKGGHELMERVLAGRGASTNGMALPEPSKSYGVPPRLGTG